MRRTQLRWPWIAACAAILMACGNTVTVLQDDDPQAGVCVPGATNACYGPGQCRGVQICIADGTGWGSCDCGSGANGNAGGAGATGNTGGTGATGNAGGSGAIGNTGGAGATGNMGGAGATGNAGGGGSDGLILWNQLGSADELANGVGVAGTVDGQVSFVPGQLGGAVQVGYGNGVTFTMGPWQRTWGVDEVTIEIWAKTSDVNQGDTFLYDFNRGCEVLVGGYLRFGQYGPTMGQFVVPGDQSFPDVNVFQVPFSWDAAFHHFASSVSKTEARAYIDGVEVGHAPIGSQAGNAMPYEIVLGQVWGKQGGYAWSGLIDDLKIYDYAKTEFDLNE